MRTAIIVPTVNRSHLLARLLYSIHSSTIKPHDVYFMVEEADEATQRVLKERMGCHVMLGAFGSYTKAANEGVRRTAEPYFLVANDDVIFHPDWDVEALKLMRDSIRVVGIDQGDGRTDCFFLVDRRYIAERSGVHDEPDAFFHDGYRSQFCDTEFAELAKARGVWADAPGALIEHRHWTFGKAEVDANYQVAIASVDHDQRLYQERRRAWAA